MKKDPQGGRSSGGKRILRRKGLNFRKGRNHSRGGEGGLDQEDRFYFWRREACLKQVGRLEE
jgi:hypothetical protein